MNNDILKKAKSILENAYGEGARFRDGQYEAIESCFTKKKTLVVQKTGWGKSLVYFISTKINRENGAGVTLVVSPLLVLMQNQLEAAVKLGLKCEALNSETKDRRLDILRGIKNDAYDLVLITPETLMSEDVDNAFQRNEIRIGLLVVDEAHCISDWGHDFRLEYGRLSKIVARLASTVPIIATTATANDRVIADLKRQLGDDVYVSRGSLFRESLSIQVMDMPDKAERYAWLAKNLKRLSGSGIIYCITTRDCDYLAQFLKSVGISAVSYHADKPKEENAETMALFSANKIKAIVATIKLGMGYDKDDVSFVIHFQRPQNIVSYYQQIGRAGRKLSNAYVFLMHGAEDKEILDYFIDTAFPYEGEARDILKVVEENPDCSKRFIESKVNMRHSRVEKAVSFLQHEGFVFETKYKYSRSPKPFVYNKAHYDAIKDIRRKEQEQMNALIKTKECYSKFIINCLDDHSDIRCGKCSNCLQRDLIPRDLTVEEKEFAARYINSHSLPIIPRRFWAQTHLTEYKKLDFINEEGFCLAKWGDAGYGEVIKKCKKENIDYPDNILNRAVEVLTDTVKKRRIGVLTYVPSLNNTLVEKFARKLASALKIRCLTLLKKIKPTHQKEMQNSSFQCENALNSYDVCGEVIKEDIILVDDMVDSRWTFTVCGYYLMERGATAVIPLALADSGQKEAND